MEQEENRRGIILAVACTAVRELLDTSSSSSDSDEEIEIIKKYVRKRKRVPQVENYVEVTVAALTDQQFKAHFRYYKYHNVNNSSFLKEYRLYQPKLKYLFYLKRIN